MNIKSAYCEKEPIFFEVNFVNYSANYKNTIEKNTDRPNDSDMHRII